MSKSQRIQIIKTLKLRSFSVEHESRSTTATTKLGDSGETCLLFDRRVPKWHIRIRLVGLLDTLNSFLNLSKTAVIEREKHAINRIQEALVYLMGEVATHEDDVERFFEFYHSLSESDVNQLEELTSRLQAEGSQFTSWVEDLKLSKGFADVARTFSRQAESLAWELISNTNTRPLLARWLNRLSDYLWALSRSD